jgi:rhodanese-related sulfurtransferase
MAPTRTTITDLLDAARPARPDVVFPDAVLHPGNALESRIDPACGDSDPRLSGDLNRRIIVVCDEGYASSPAAATLRDCATDVAGGFQVWRRDGRPA